MKMMTKTRRLAGSAVLAALLVASVSPSAVAAEITRAYTTDNEPGGMAEWRAHGEVLYVRDTQAGDGYHAWAGVYSDTRLDLLVKEEDGEDAGGDTRNWSYPEGMSLWLRTCLQKGSDGPGKYCSWTRIYS
ncbi:hypothetical protein [Streptomyces sp. Tue 6075]|uniref:hypothetical protein n=1 Tax=Streptomyces sp. Tue 6075 TaxID=1661694 RepID=UPI00131BD825|nr:hypothetical protein [Streptomyces sp. Tue 6075]